MLAAPCVRITSLLYVKVLLRRYLAHGNLQSECAQSSRHFVVDYCLEWEPVVAQTAQVPPGLSLF